jgi:SlyX protein
MTPTHDMEQRLEALEIKASFTDDLIDKLDQVIIRQQQTLDAVVSELRALRQQMGAGSESAAPRTLRDELPPHY